jgi:cation diffusion facilitator family transporter
LLTCLKFATAEISGSVSLFSEAIHSLLDLVSAGITFFTLRESIKPADLEHPFGHGKMENLSSLFECVLLLLAAVLIIKESTTQWSHIQPVTHQPASIAVLVFSLIVSFFAYQHNSQAAIKLDSRALETNATHFLADAASNLAVLLGFILMHFTGWQIIDPVLALCVAAYLVTICIPQIKSNIAELIDNRLPVSEIEQIVEKISLSKKEFIQFRKLRTRKSGNHRHIDFQVVFCGSISVGNAYAVCDTIENNIKAVFTEPSISIYMRPCEKQKTQCFQTCPHFRKENF